MSNLQAFLLLGVVGFVSFHHWGLIGAVGAVATIWLLSPHGPKIV